MNNHSESYRSFLICLFASLLSAVVYILGILHITDPLSKATLFALTPMFSGVNALQIEINNEISTVIEARNLVNKYKALEQQNIQLRAEVAQRDLIREENIKLREQLGAPQVDQFKMAPAKVVSKERELTIVYDSGTRIAQSSAVVFRNNFIGKVRDFNNRSATVILATDPEMSVPVDIINNDKTIIKATLHGQFGTGMIADMISQDAKIGKGNLVVISKTPGLPAGVLVGEIREVYKNESDLFQTAKVNSFIEFDTLDTVFIIQ